MNYVHLYKQSKYKGNRTYHAIFFKLVKIKTKRKILKAVRKKDTFICPVLGTDRSAEILDNFRFTGKTISLNSGNMNTHNFHKGKTCNSKDSLTDFY